MSARFGVIGAGALGQHHVRILRDVAGDRFVGFYDDNADRAAAIAAQYGVQAHLTLDSLLDAADAVSIVVPTTAHYAVALRAIQHGCHLFLEKPITVTLGEADDVLGKAHAAQRVVQVGHVERFNRAVRAAMPYVDQPRFIESDRLAPFNPRGSDVAVVLDLMIHDIDLVRTLVGASVTDVQATGVPVLTPQVDMANARLQFANGAVANVTASRVSRERVRKLRLFQRSGYLSLDLAAGRGEFFRMRGDINPLELMTQPRALEEFVERIPLEAPEEEPLKLELAQFVEAVNGRAPIAVTGAEGREALAVALQIMATIEQGMEAERAAFAAAAHGRP
jgi:predicted dehydrogenase